MRGGERACAIGSWRSIPLSADVKSSQAFMIMVLGEEEAEAMEEIREGEAARNEEQETLAPLISFCAIGKPSSYSTLRVEGFIKKMVLLLAKKLGAYGIL